jgi:hypothetical protein
MLPPQMAELTYLTATHIQDVLKVSPPTLRNWVKQGLFPKPLYLGPVAGVRSCSTQRWRREVVEEFLRKVESGANQA